VRWIDNLFKDSRDEDALINPKTEADLIKKLSYLARTSMVILPLITFTLYVMQDRVLPHFLFEWANTIKHQIFFDRYLHLIEQGGLAFADQFFIAYVIVLATHIISFSIFLVPGSFLIRYKMKPVKRITKLMKKRILLFLLASIFMFYAIWTQGQGLDQRGFFRANESAIIGMLIFVGVMQPLFTTALLFPVMKFIFVAYDSWRDGIFREVFFSQT